MLSHPKTLRKLAQIVLEYLPLRFLRLEEVPVEVVETKEHLGKEPEGAKWKWKSLKAGGRYGGSGITGWLRGDFVVPKAAAGTPLFIQFEAGVEPIPLMLESLLLIDGKHLGVMNQLHHEVLISAKPKAGTKHHLAIEAYCGHNFPSTMPHDKGIFVPAEGREFRGVFLAKEREDVSAFCYDLQVLLKLTDVLDANSMRKATLTRELGRVWELVPALPHELSEEEWRPALAAARQIMAPLLARKNSPTTPTLNVVAHSHLDTAWLWTVAESRRKCGRTYSSMVNLMERFPEVVFMQSSPCHADMLRQDFPAVFERVRSLVAEGRWEPNGGSWIEPDCNLTGGESLVRQFVHGIRFTREHFNYSPDTFWQPDVFGYAAALPQILKGVGISYFCTTKMQWNDTTRFPYDTFEWQGIDGTTVLTHLNSLPQSVEADDMVKLWNWAQHKDSEERRLASFGWGDGGGGTTAEDLERLRRMENLEGMPKVEYSTVSDFMRTISRTKRPWPRFVGELYLELHRGTLTSMARFKRSNRKTELALRDAEFLHLLTGAEYPVARFDAVWKMLLLNQFHDILPGTSIAEANDVALREFAQVEADGEALAGEALATLAGASKKGKQVALANSLNWTRTSAVLTGLPAGRVPIGEHVTAQSYSNLDGAREVAVSGLELPPLAVISCDLGAPPEGISPFHLDGDRLETPFAKVRFDSRGRITSYVLKESGREAVGEGPLNAFLCGEDIPEVWDAWDIDSDQEAHLRVEDRLAKREVVANGPLQLRIRSEWKIGRSSTLRQDAIFHAAGARVDFDTRVDWKERHQLLKVSFPINVLSETAKFEIQYGHVDRPTHRNYLQDRARFEVCCHKWMDLSDNGFGVAILNDCKYGVGVKGSEVRLSLLKSGTHPDPRADEGMHRFLYSFLPHEGPFSVAGVARPAYELNVPVRSQQTERILFAESLLRIDNPNVVVESIKRAEDGRGMIVRLYDAGRMRSRVAVAFGGEVKQVEEVNLLEEKQRSLALRGGRVELDLGPFEIKTLRVIS
jgi:alpha-mannosidase